jgi:hypothetical protein
MKTLLILHLLAGDPITAIVDERVCLVAVESFNAGHELEIFDKDGEQPQITDVECQPVCEEVCA